MPPILFIDDDVLALQLMSKVTDLLGFRAITSTSPSSALALAQREKPSLILVDMQMDEMDGTEFVRQVRQRPGIASLPVFILTAGTGAADADRARRAGADGLLMKPLGLNTLSQTIQAYLRA